MNHPKYPVYPSGGAGLGAPQVPGWQPDSGRQQGPGSFGSGPAGFPPQSNSPVPGQSSGWSGIGAGKPVKARDRIIGVTLAAVLVVAVAVQVWRQFAVTDEPETADEGGVMIATTQRSIWLSGEYANGFAEPIEFGSTVPLGLSDDGTLALFKMDQGVEAVRLDSRESVWKTEDWVCDIRGSMQDTAVVHRDRAYCLRSVDGSGTSAEVGALDLHTGQPEVFGVVSAEESLPGYPAFIGTMGNATLIKIGDTVNRFENGELTWTTELNYDHENCNLYQGKVLCGSSGDTEIVDAESGELAPYLAGELFMEGFTLFEETSEYQDIEALRAYDAPSNIIVESEEYWSINSTRNLPKMQFSYPSYKINPDPAEIAEKGSPYLDAEGKVAARQVDVTNVANASGEVICEECDVQGVSATGELILVHNRYTGETATQIYAQSGELLGEVPGVGYLTDAGFVDVGAGVSADFTYHLPKK